MKKIIINEEFWEVFPDAKINVLVVGSINNEIKDEEKFKEILNNSKEISKKYIAEEEFTQNAVIKDWREAFSKIKTKKGARSSIEALLKRVSQDRDFSPINPLVDIYNSISLVYGVPCGGEDIDKLVGNLMLGKAKGDERFLALGDSEVSCALEEEMIYYDTEGAVCRSLNWREAQRTMLTEDTKNAVFVIEAIKKEQHEQIDGAAFSLQKQLEEYYDTKVKSFSLTKESSSQEL